MLEIKEFNKIIVANWKLNGSNDFLEAYFEKFPGIKIQWHTNMGAGVDIYENIFPFADREKHARLAIDL